MYYLVLFMSLFVLCALLLWVIGDFTGYVWVSDRDVLITRTSIGHHLLLATMVGVFFALATVILLAVSGLFVTGYYSLRLFLSLVLPFMIVVFFFGDFKTLLGGRGEYIVMYELPHGPERLLISLACGILLALVTSVVLVAFGFDPTRPNAVSPEATPTAASTLSQRL